MISSYNSHTRKAEVIQVIKTVTLAGRGVEGDPAREVIQYWSLEGRLLAVADPLEQEGRRWR